MTTSRADLRTHYTRVRTMIANERKKRESVLSHSPLLPKKLKECDDALASLAALGEAINELLPADDAAASVTATQAPLIEVPPIKRPYS